MDIPGAEGLSRSELADEVARGGRFVQFPYCVSLCVITLRFRSGIRFIPAGGSAAGHGLPYVLLSLLLGWWGFPFGLIFTPIAVITCLSGGNDVTSEMVSYLGLHRDESDYDDDDDEEARWKARRNRRPDR
jgi:hypothetical protein